MIIAPCPHLLDSLCGKCLNPLNSDVSQDKLRFDRELLKFELFERGRRFCIRESCLFKASRGVAAAELVCISGVSNTIPNWQT
mmetsp:Transcript_5407/g.12029  ORF Transcript_5407/g.12029 Transcript_5407/m.12029 type:complete len:83 (+) Transcript_5407:4601-4849(+)